MINRGYIQKADQVNQESKGILQVIDGPAFDLWLEKLSNVLFTTSLIFAIPFFIYLFISMM